MSKKDGTPSVHRSRPSLRDDLVAAALCVGAAIGIGILIGSPAQADEAVGFESPIAIEWEHDLFFDGDSARLMPTDGFLRPFLAAGGGLRRWNPDAELLSNSSLVSEEWLTGVSAGLDLQLTDPLALRVYAGWVQNMSLRPALDSDYGFGTAGARLELRF